MGLNKAQLASAIHDALNSMESNGTDQSWSFSNALAEAIDTFVKSGQVIGNTSGGICKYSGPHDQLPIIGQVV